MPLDLTVIILTKNESLHIERAILNIQGLAKQIIVVDSFSTDDTVAVAEKHGALVVQHKFVTQAKQFQWALDTTNIEGSWIMRLDADELIEPNLLAEIERRLPQLPSDVVGINLKRKHIFMDRWVRFGGRYPVVLLRIWRKGHGSVEDRWMDEHILVSGGRCLTFEGSFADHNLNDLSFFTAKHNAYATREALDVLVRRYQLREPSTALNLKGASTQAVVKRFLKESLYNKLPFTISAMLYFFWRYIFQLGFLDGRTGLIYHFLQGYWYRFLVGAKILELESSISNASDREEIRRRLEAVTGFKLDRAN